MKISSGRFSLLEATLVSWVKTGLPFLWECREVVGPVENTCAEEPGLYYFVPLLAKTCGLSIKQAVVCWDFSLTILGALIAVGAFFYLSQTKFEKAIATFGVAAVAVICWVIGDVYLASYFAVCFPPWVFIVVKNSSDKLLMGYCVIVGLVTAFSNSIRMHAGTALALGVLSTFVLYTKNIKKSFLVVVFLGVGLYGYSLWFSSLFYQRDAYLAGKSSEQTIHGKQHLFWHTVYAGLGFLSNPYGLYFGDPCPAECVQAADSSVLYGSLRYNAVLRQQTLKFCKEHPQFVLRTLFAKGGVLFYYFLLFANLGLVCAWFYRKPWYIELSYWLVLAFSSLPGLLAIPVAPYLSGFIVASVFYSIHSAMWALQHGLWTDTRRKVGW